MAYSANADYRTTKGSIAPDLHWSGPDDTYGQRDQIRQWIETNFTPAKVVRDSTRTYNCHGFAHASAHAWFNSIAQFLADDYYQYTPGTLRVGDIAVYAKGGVLTHSGIITQLAGNAILQVRSKWGALSEVLHPPERVPVEYGPIQYYLRKRGTMAMAESEERDVVIRARELIEQLTRPDRLFQLDLASTPEVASRIAREFPEMLQLKLCGSAAAEELLRRLRDATDDEAPVLAYALAVTGFTAALPAISERIEALRDHRQFTPAECLLDSALTELLGASEEHREAVRNIVASRNSPRP